MKFKHLYQALVTSLRAKVEDSTEIHKRSTRYVTQYKYIVHYNTISEKITWKRYVIENNHAFDEFAREARNRKLHANNKTYTIIDVEKHLDWFMVTVEEVK